MENERKQKEEQRFEMKELIKKKDKIIWTSMWVIMTASFLSLLILYLLTFLFVPEVWQPAAVVGATVLFLIPCFYALKLEISVGCYKCKKCGHEIVPSFAQALRAMHMGTTRYLKCPACQKRTWCKKVLWK